MPLQLLVFFTRLILKISYIKKAFLSIVCIKTQKPNEPQASKQVSQSDFSEKCSNAPF